MKAKWANQDSTGVCACALFHLSHRKLVNLCGVGFDEPKPKGSRL